MKVSKYLLDASALVNILPVVSAESLRTSGDVELYITQLTPFEVGNALWKLHIRGEIESDEALIIMELADELIKYGSLNMVQVGDIIEIMKLTLRRKITFYDASYIFAAKKFGFILVTDDNGLRTNAEIEKVRTMSSDKLMEAHPDIFEVKEIK